MASGIDGVGETVTGGMVARAVEPEAGEAEAGAHDGEIGGNCLNCEAALTGPYCHECGQKARVHRSVGAIAHDLVHGILHLDGKFWRTLPLLVWRPGDLTRRYVHGERAKFVSPMAMFLFSVFLMFAALSIYGVSLASLDMSTRGNARQGLQSARTEVSRELAQARAERAALARGGRVEAGGRPAAAARLDGRIADLQAQLDGIGRIERGMGDFERGADGAPNTGWARLDQGIRKFSENPSLALYKLQSTGYKFSWLLIPLSVPFVWLLFFWTRRYHFYDHTVFVTYSLAFMSLLAILLTVLGFAGVPGPVIGVAAVLIPPIHMFRQLKQAYRLHWASTLVRTILLVGFCSITASLFSVLLLGIGALG